MKPKTSKFSLATYLALIAGAVGATLILTGAAADTGRVRLVVLHPGIVEIPRVWIGILVMLLGICLLWLPVDQLAAAALHMKEWINKRGQNIPIITTLLILVPLLITILALHFLSKNRAADIAHPVPEPISIETDTSGAVLLGDGLPILPSTLNLSAIPLVGSLDAPLGIIHAGDGSHRLFILERSRIRVVKEGALVEMPFLALSEGRELLGLAFDPDFTANGFFYVSYIAPQEGLMIARYSVRDKPDRADPDSEVIVLTVQQSEAFSSGGSINFGLDGYLYILIGDSAALPERSEAQNGGSLPGSILRVDVSQFPYRIPSDNPFVSNPKFRNEIWAFGLGSPHHFAFDQDRGDLYVTDAGPNGYDEVDVVWAHERGVHNFGWPLMEGFECVTAVSCGADRFSKPLLAVDHQQSCQITGGLVYRGARYPELQGAYLFADFCEGRIWAYQQDYPDSVPQISYRDLDIEGLSAFGEDESGELYVVSVKTGVLYRLVIANP